MNIARSTILASITALTLTTLLPFQPANSATYEEVDLEQKDVIAVAAPFGTNKYNLLLIEQIPGKKQCWSESGEKPAKIDPLLLSFDFTGQCNRATDSNGYSIRLDGEDYGLDYLLSIVPKNGELVLIATNRKNRSQLIVGRSYGMTDGFTKMYLSPGWRFSKRSFQGKKLGHFYFSGKQAEVAANLPPDGTDVNPIPTTPPSTTTFGDLNGDVYKTEIEKAVALGFVAGYKEDNTFRPTTPLTREQLVSIVIGALTTVQNLKIDVPAQINKQPYPDVPTNRWSAAKILWAQQNKIVSGYPDGSFKPEKPVTRAELMAVLKKAAEYARVKRGQTPELVGKEPLTPTNFTDIKKHWAADLVTQMSTYCRVASPLNEKGTVFAPNEATGRNYAAAATVRMRDCLQ
jgi:N-acetylmuramoyl-L-alanine amidase